MSQPFRLRYVNQIVGAILLLTLLVFLALALFVIRGRYVFARSVDFQVAIPQNMVSGLRRGSDVSILGDTVGRVHRISYAPNNNDVLLDLKVKAPFRDQIMHDSKIQVRRKFGVGEPYLEIIRGNDLLGAQTAVLTEELRRDENIAATEGAFVAKVLSGSAAEKAGLQSGDVIQAIDNKLTPTPGELDAAMGQLTTGQKFQLHVIDASGTAKSIDAIAERPAPTQLPGAPSLSFVDSADPRISGMSSQVNSTLGDFRALTQQSARGLDETFFPSFTTFNKASESFYNTSETLRPATVESLTNVNDFIVHMREEIDELMKTVDEVVVDDAKPLLNDLASTLENVNGLLDELGPEAIETLNGMEGAAKSLDETLEGLNEVVTILDRELQSLPGTIPQVRQTISNVNEVVCAVRNSRLIKGMIRRSNGGCGRISKPGTPSCRQPSPPCQQSIAPYQRPTQRWQPRTGMRLRRLRR